MVLGSHNSWSYLKPTKWWMKLISFTTKCQRTTIQTQYLQGARCFDLHIRIGKDDIMTVVHGPIEYCYLVRILNVFDTLNNYKDVSIRLILDLRIRYAKKEYENQITFFKLWCYALEDDYPNIKFWCGRTLPTWEQGCIFDYDPSCEERHGSVTKPKWLWGLWPWLYAKLHNKEIIEQSSDKDILLIDYIDIK